MNESLSRFTDLLQALFGPDTADLDFGIYRMMRLRQALIGQFLTGRLPQLVQETLSSFAQGSPEETRAQMTQLGESAAGMGMTAESLPDAAQNKQPFRRLQRQLTNLSALERDVYAALYDFFHRYYADGDFISGQRCQAAVCATACKGEEVQLCWANQDQYYIKTGEIFRDYTFTADGITVHFRLTYATTEQNNNKERKDRKRTFMLFTEDEARFPSVKTFSYDPEAAEIVIRFVYDVQTKYTGRADVIDRKWREDNGKAITAWLRSLRRAELNALLSPIDAGKGKGTTTLPEKHLKRYTAKSSTFDYFIHKDLRGFLTRELDFFIKSEVMDLDDLDAGNEARAETRLAKVRAVRRVGDVIIDRLSRIEDFQKKLWLKKKFVVETNWCITLDRIGEVFWPEILANKAQIDEWIDLYAIDEAAGWTNPPTAAFLRENPYLPIDTMHFSDAFKYALLESIPDPDAQTDGILIRSENAQALRLLRKTYAQRVKCVYIDPPYNARSSEILYKNTYRHSSWLSMMHERLLETLPLLRQDFTFFVAIDEIEQEVLGQLLSRVFPNCRKVCVSVVHNPRGKQGTNVSYTHEFVYIIYPDDRKKYLADVRRAEVDARNLRDSGTESDRTDAATCFYPFIVRDGQIVGVGEVPDDNFHPAGNNVRRDDGSMEIWPVDDAGHEKKWRYSVSSVPAILPKLEVRRGRAALQIIFRQDMGTMRSLWADARYDASEYGTKVLQSILGVDYAAAHAPNLYPKSVHTETDCITVGCNGDRDAAILDFFAGSGTTGHAVVSMNRADGGHRKYILAEMGEYFDTVTMRRMKKVIYAPDWKDGKPLSRSRGVSQMVRYMRLESFEDTLSNIELPDRIAPLRATPDDEHAIRYMADPEIRDNLLNTDAFTDPFACTMKITEKNACKTRPVDLAETFNLLLGLTVSRRSAVTVWRSDAAAAPRYAGESVFVRDPDGPYAFRHVEGILPDGRRALVIWRTVTDDRPASDAALGAYFTACCKTDGRRPFDVIFVNGDSTPETLRDGDEYRHVQKTETEFKKLMFEGT